MILNYSFLWSQMLGHFRQIVEIIIVISETNNIIAMCTKINFCFLNSISVQIEKLQKFRTFCFIEIKQQQSFLAWWIYHKTSS